MRAIIFIIRPILEARAELQKYFSSVFGSNENFEICFWDWLTITVYLPEILFLKAMRVAGIFFPLNDMISELNSQFQITVIFLPLWQKVIKYQKQISNFSFEPKTKLKYFCNSALASKLGQIMKIMADYHAG